MALANVVSTSQMDELARVFVTLFDAKHLLAPLLWNIFYREVEVRNMVIFNVLCLKKIALSNETAFCAYSK